MIVGVCRLIANHLHLAFFESTPEVRVLPSTGITRLQRSYYPVRLPPMPPPEATLRPLPSHQTGLPRLPEPPFRRAVPTTRKLVVLIGIPLSQTRQEQINSRTSSPSATVRALIAFCAESEHSEGGDPLQTTIKAYSTPITLGRTRELIAAPAALLRAAGCLYDAT